MNECAHVCRTLRGQKRASCLVELETKMVMLVLGTKPKSSTKTANALNS